MKASNTGEMMLQRLKRLGVDYFFANPGTEFVSVIRGFQELPADSVPVPVLAPHELQAVNMAYGYYLATGRPQAVMTHATVGAANALTGLIGAARMNIPLIFISGMTAQNERGAPGFRDKLIHWSQDTRDQGSLFREYVKWEAEIRDPSSLNTILDRAYAVAMTEPRGPVALKVPREVLVAPAVDNSGEDVRISPASASEPGTEAMKQILEWLAQARKPVVVTNRLGSDPENVALLVKASERHGLGVITPEDFYLSFPMNHPNHLGFQFDPGLGADFVLVLDTEAPWFPLDRGPSNAKVVHAGPDPLFASLPLRGHAGNLFVNTSSKALLNKMLEAPATDPAQRLWTQPSGIFASAAGPGRLGPETLSAELVSTVLSEFINEDTLLINELGLQPDALNCTVAGTYFRSGSASPLGWGVGAAVGLGLAHKQKTVIAAIGDGVFYLSPMAAALSSAAALQTSLVVLILNNGGMASIEKTVKDFYPETKRRPPLTAFPKGSNLESCASIVNGLGLRAEDTAQLREALIKAVCFARERRLPAVINAVFGGTQ